MLSLTEKLTDNAMLYKDITQAVRNRVFLGLFTLLLLASECCCLVGLMVMEEEKGYAGPLSFGLLCGALGFYSLAVAAQGSTLTGKEFLSRTFELYALSGISPEGVVAGKFSSMMSQYLFGVSVIAPFMFVSYLMGGLDFYTVFACLIMMSLIVPPIYLLALGVGFGQKTKALGNLGRGLSIVFLIMFLPYIIMFVASFFFGGGMDPAGWIKLLLTGDAGAWQRTIGMGLVYLQVCLLLFYACCHMICPSCDSRETPLKMFITTLAFSWMAYLLFFMMKSTYHDVEELVYAALMPVSYLSCLLGLIFYYHRLEPPLMARKRISSGKWATPRLVHYWFAPGAWGTLRVVLLLWLSMAFFSFVAMMWDGSGDVDKIRAGVALALQAPFFIIFPGGLLYNFRSFRRRGFMKLRAVVFMWWALGGLIGSIGPVFLSQQYGMDNIFIRTVQAGLSPISSLVALADDANPVAAEMDFIRLVMGVLGLGLMLLTLRRRQALADQAALQPPKPGEGEEFSMTSSNEVTEA